MTRKAKWFKGMFLLAIAISLSLVVASPQLTFRSASLADVAYPPPLASDTTVEEATLAQAYPPPATPGRRGEPGDRTGAAHTNAYAYTAASVSSLKWCQKRWHERSRRKTTCSMRAAGSGGIATARRNIAHRSIKNSEAAP